jgi:hypothetical protein
MATRLRLGGSCSQGVDQVSFNTATSSPVANLRHCSQMTQFLIIACAEATNLLAIEKKNSQK